MPDKDTTFLVERPGKATNLVEMSDKATYFIERPGEATYLVKRAGEGLTLDDTVERKLLPLRRLGHT
jgi:hypothetical protein